MWEYYTSSLSFFIFFLLNIVVYFYEKLMIVINVIMTITVESFGVLQQMLYQFKYVNQYNLLYRLKYIIYFGKFIFGVLYE